MKFSSQTASELSPMKLVNLLNRGFAGYFVPIKFTKTLLQTLIKRDDIRLDQSLVLFANGKPSGIALIALRGTSSRVAAMAIETKLRGRKAGHWLLEQVIQQSINRTEKTIHLEVIGQNEAAIHLYEKFGFKKIRHLLGWKIESNSDEPMTGLINPCDSQAVINLVSKHGLTNLPWQIDATTLENIKEGLTGFHHGQAYALTTNTAEEHIILRSLIVPKEARRQGHASALIKRLLAAFPNKTWHVPAICPEEMTPFFEKYGFQKEEIWQWQMEREQ